MTVSRPQGAKVAVLTGATGGMGQVMAVTLARAGWQVVAVVRDQARAASLLELVNGLPGRVHLLTADLSSREGILAATRDIRKQHGMIHLLINNAGAHFAEHRLSEDGIEMHVAVDYLASYGLTSGLSRELARGEARVVNVASDTLRDTRKVTIGGRPRPATIDLRDLGDLASLNPKEGFVSFEAYGRAKLLTVMAGYSLARRLRGDGITVNSLHPGIVNTEIVDKLIPALLRPFGGLIRRSILTPGEGAAAILRLAVDPELSGATGRYFVREVDTATPPISYDLAAQAVLIDATERFLAAGR